MNTALRLNYFISEKHSTSDYAYQNIKVIYFSLKSAMITSVSYFIVELDPTKFSEEQKNVIDFENLKRHIIKVSVKTIDEKYYDAFKHLNKLQYNLPMRYLKPISEACTYVSQKSLLYENERDIRNAAITIEPLHPNFFNMVIPHTPIDQNISLGTVFTLYAKVPFLNDKNGNPPKRKFISSNNLKTGSAENFLKNVHYGAIDIGSEIKGKFIVSQVDLELMNSFSLFGFRRSDEDKEFMLWIYNYYGISMKELLEIIKNKTTSDNCRNLIKDILDKLPSPKTLKNIQDVLKK
jgi:hypothetical protein